MIIDFLIKGILRDKARSLLPIVVVMIGVFTVVFMDGIVGGMMDNMVRMTAKFQTGHVKVVSRAYWEDKEQSPIDLALMNAKALEESLQKDFPTMDWVERIPFGGLLDIPASNRETRTQGPVFGTAYNFLGAKDKEKIVERLGLQDALVVGKLIERTNEVLVSIDFAEKYKVEPGDDVTFFGSTMYSSMTFGNYKVAGIVRFGNPLLDRGAIFMDIADARILLDMEDAVSELLGFFPDDRYDRQAAEEVKEAFNGAHRGDKDEYAPYMVQLADQNAMDEMLAYASETSMFMLVILVVALSIVLWNAGIIGGIRRYNEFGLRIALGEGKGHIFCTLLIESFFIGIIGSVCGTILALLLCLYIQSYGIDYSAMMQNMTLMIDPVIRAKVTMRMYYIGFIPGVCSMILGSALAGRAIFKRQTATLFKELD